MNPTPLYSALRALSSQGHLRLHMPGHKGKPLFPGWEEVFALDYTETYETGNLYAPDADSPIRPAERLAAACYGAADCHFLTGGSTQGVHAMLAACCTPGGPVLLDRTCHKSAASACALLDLRPAFVFPSTLEPFGFGGMLDLHAVEAALAAHPDAPALLIVSPNYYGVVQDIPALAALCRRYGKLLLVDAAHAAHFPALGLPSPIEQGADAAVVSAHKTLPCLGQGAYLLLSDRVDGGKLRMCEAMVGTSSPSYAILASLDLARAWMQGEGRAAYAAAARQTATLRGEIQQSTPLVALDDAAGLPLDPCRLTLCCARTTLDGQAAGQALYARYDIALELTDQRNLVAILTGADSPDDFARLRDALVRLFGSLSGAGAPPPPLPAVPSAEPALPVRRAWFAPCRTVPLRQAVGAICARPVTPYPPGIPLLWPGERITAAHIEFLRCSCYDADGTVQICADASL